MGNFKDDLLKGKEAEIRLMDKLNEEGIMNVIQNPKEKEMDLLIITQGIEVKLDDYATYSGNFYIEFECNGKLSGIFREENIVLSYWAQCTSEKCYLVAGSKLKDYVAKTIDDCRANKSLTSCGVRLVENGGNGGRTKGLLIPISKFEEMSEQIIVF